jgi:uncharacterized protein
MPVFRKSRYTVAVPFDTNVERMAALYQTMTEAFILIPESAWSHLNNGSSAGVNSSTVDMLSENGFLVNEGVNETALFKAWMQQYVHDFSTIKSKVLVTRRCNNQCIYCILDPKPKDMSRNTAIAMDRFYLEIIKEKHPRKVQDDYLGGEPLLNPGIILESAARRYFYCLGRGIEYGFTITTNGTLLQPSIIIKMKEAGLSGIRVSMAGPGPVHDSLRPSAGGGKTYDLIIRNLKNISGLIPISIECQYDASSQDYQNIPEMLDDFSKYDIPIENIAFTPILPRRGRSLFNTGMGDPEKFLYLKQEARKRGYPVDDESPKSACMADFRSRFIFDVDGHCLPCPSLGHSEMAYGHVNTGIDFVLESQLLQRELPDRCLNKCELLPICMGGCRLQALIKNDDFGGIDCNYDACNIFLKDFILHKAQETLSRQGCECRKEAA